MIRRLLFFILSSLVATSAFALSLVHNQVLTAAAGQDIPISVNLSGANGNVQYRLFYRVKGSAQYSSSPMIGDNFSASGSIPAAYVTTDGVEYYIAALSNGSMVGSQPSVSPAINPYYVTVHIDASKPSLEILSPMDGDVVTNSNPVITVSYDNGDKGIDVSSVRVLIDGKDVEDPKQVQTFTTLMSYVPSKALSEGDHTVLVSVKNNSGALGSIKWTFTVNTTGAVLKPNKNQVVWSGYASYDTTYGFVTQEPSNPTDPLPFRPYGSNTLDTEVDGRGGNETYQLKALVSDTDRSDEQATDRVHALMKIDQSMVVLGDYSPSLSLLTLYQPVNLRGVTLDLVDGDLQDGHTHLIGVWGQLERAVAAGTEAFSNGATNGTYAQSTYGVHWDFGNKYLQLGANAVTINDDEDSLSNNQAGTTQPNYIGMMSAEARIAIPQIYFSTNGEYAAQYDFSGPSIDDLAVGSANVVYMDLNILPSGTHLAANWRDLGGYFGLYSGSGSSSLPIPGGYNVIGDPGLAPDYRGVDVTLSQALWGNQIVMSGEYNHYSNDLENTVDTTPIDTMITSATLTVAPHNLPSVMLQYNNTAQESDLGQVLVQADGTTITPTDNYSNNLLLNLGYTDAINTTISLATNAGIQQTSTRDISSFQNQQNQYNYNYMLSGLLKIDNTSLTLAGTWGYIDIAGVSQAGAFSSYDLGSGLTTNDVLNASVQQQWIPQSFSTTLAYNYTTSSGTVGATPNALSSENDSTRSTYTVAGQYNIGTMHTFNLALNYATDAVTTLSGGVGGVDDFAMFYSDASYKLSF